MTDREPRESLHERTVEWLAIKHGSYKLDVTHKYEGLISIAEEALQKERTARLEAENALRAYELDIVGYPLTERVKQLETALRECLEANYRFINYPCTNNSCSACREDDACAACNARITLEKHKGLVS